jgi:hypothetical protein
MIVSTFALLLFLGGSPAAADTGGSASVTIVVDDAGTKVHNKGATWVSVTPNADGKTQVVSPGGRAEYGGAPDVAATATASGQAGARSPAAPSLIFPNDGEQVKVKTSDRGPGQVVLTWTPVAGAREYAVEFTVDNGKPILLKTPKAEARLPPIPGGKVAWAVRTLGDGSASEPSGRRWFQLQAEPIKVEARPSGWK